MRRLICSTLAGFVLLAFAVPARADEKDGRLDIYFIDVEGGASTLLVTPTGESALVDSGFPGFDNRDRNRILDVVKKVAGRDHLDHAFVTHWHLDHYGNHAALAAEMPIRNFWDRGLPESVPEDRQYITRSLEYRAASQNMSRTLKAGNVINLNAKETPLKFTILTASRETVPNTGEPNPFAAEHQPQADDTSDNAASLTFLWEFGPFRFLCCGDLTWNMEAKLVTPNNPIGKIDLFMVTHHGMGISNNPVLVKAIDPVTAVMCNGPTKGGDPQTIATVRKCPSLVDFYQLHRNIRAADEDQTRKELIANSEAACQGIWIKASVAPDGKSYTIQIGPEGKPKIYQTRAGA